MKPTIVRNATSLSLDSLRSVASDDSAGSSTGFAAGGALGSAPASAQASRTSLASLRDMGRAARAKPKLPRRGTETPLDPPAHLFPALFPDVQMNALFKDQKTFADAVPKTDPAIINQAYEVESVRPGFSLPDFVARHFALERQKQVPSADGFNTGWRDYVRDGWDRLTLAPGDVQRWSSLLAIQHRSVVPGGRFSEPNYWDMAFTLPGLLLDGRRDLAFDMLCNAADCIDRFGHVPNGFRTYQLSRSQPPVFAMMVQDIAAHDGNDALFTRFLPQMRAEHDFWMDGADALRPGDAHRRAVRLPDGTVLNRYWDDRPEPRDESYLEDVETADHAAEYGRAHQDTFRDLRAACESGWDFSARWFADHANLRTVRTTQIVPVDLNSLMVNLERCIAHGHLLQGDADAARGFTARADARAAAIRTTMWHADGAMFTDLLRDGSQTGFLSAATAFPLRFGIASESQSLAVAGTIRRALLLPGGLATTTHDTAQQWDYPNSWAPLQDIAVDGLQNHDPDLAREIGGRWCRSVLGVYQSIGAIVEKYNAAAATAEQGVGAGGEYEVQVGFAWTNGILRKLMARYPEDLAAARITAGSGDAPRSAVNQEKEPS